MFLDLKSDSVYRVKVGSADDDAWYSTWYEDDDDVVYPNEPWDALVWSEVLVYPTDIAPWSEQPKARVAGIPVEAYQADGRYAYTICDPAQAPQDPYQPSQIPNGFLGGWSQ